ncbi:MAG: hypothetical protein C4563_01870 [Desulfobulbus sp.]|nr:MAG: hypothetical protein C4563_01870 [Desulfobulbus sp.]
MDQEITHGICSLCAIKFTGTAPRKLKDLLDIISEPVLLVDGLGVVKAANESGLKLLGKDLTAVENLRGGEVFECTYANLPGGCGHTVHCMTCAIRNILMDTLAQGHGYSRVPAFQKIRTPTGERIMRYYISTERIGDRILLRIDDVVDRVTA